MLRSLCLLCVLIVCLNAIASAQSRHPHAPPNAGTLHQLQKNAPRLIWHASLAGKETVRVAGVGSKRIAVLAEPRPRMEKGVYIPHSVQLLAFDVKSGDVAWRREILGGDITSVADDSRLYMRLQLPRVSYNSFDFKPDDIKYEIVTLF